MSDNLTAAVILAAIAALLAYFVSTGLGVVVGIIAVVVILLGLKDST